MISFIPARNYLFKVSNLSTRIMCESCLILRMSVLMIFNINDASGIVLVSLLLNGTYFKLYSKVCLVQIEETNTSEDKIGHIICYVVVL